MKQIFFIAVAAIFAFVVGCDNPANMEAMKAQTARTIDSLAAAEVAAQRAALLATCNQNIDAAIQLRVDSLMAIATPTKPALSGKKPTPTKPAPTKPAPTTPTKPTPTPPKSDPIKDQQNSRPQAGTPEAIKEQKGRGNATTVNEDKTAKPEEVKKQKGRGAATSKPVDPKTVDPNRPN